MQSISFTKRAMEMIERRAIDQNWVVSTLSNPEVTRRDERDHSLTLAFRRIPEFDSRWLRVV